MHNEECIMHNEGLGTCFIEPAGQGKIAINLCKSFFCRNFAR